MNPDLFAGRYELLHEAPPGAAGRLFEARDTQTGEFVALKVLKRELGPNAPERYDLEHFYKASKACPNPRLIRYDLLALDQGFLVREWIHGFPLIDLLRRRRELPAQEVITLLHEVPETIDAAVAADLAPTGDLLTRLFVSWDRKLPADELVRLRGVPVTEWQNFVIKLSPMSLSQVLPLSPEETMSTIVGPLMAQAGPMLSPSAAFAEAIYQLLGAPRRSDRSRRYVPLGTLNEAGNTMLRRVIEGGTPPKLCTGFWKDFLEATGLHPQPRKPVLPSPPPPPIFASAPPQVQAQAANTPSGIPAKAAPPIPPPIASHPIPTPPPSSAPAPAGPPMAVPPPLPKRHILRIPERFVGNLQPGTILRLTPRDISFTPIHLIARPSFRIGRSLYHSDFITRVLPETAENEKLTKEIGRVHVLAELRGSQITLRDGNGEQGSVNGSAFEEHMLSPEKPTPVEKRGLLSLYRNYELEIAPLLGSTDLGWQIENEEAWPGPGPTAPALQGAVVFYPKRNQPMLRQAAWIFSRLDFAISSRGDVTWSEAGSPLSQASFLFYRGQFWLTSFTAPPGTIFVNNQEVPRNAIIPLSSGEPIQLGPGAYIAEIQ